MHLVINEEPIAKKRPRFSKFGTYDVQTRDKRGLKWLLSRQMRENGFLKLCNEPVSFEVLCYCSIPESLSERKKKALCGIPVTKKPDLDNYLKFYADVLNGIAYEDDNLIASIRAEKRYSDKPRVEININPYGGSMINEHALTVKGDITMEDLDYMVKKANRLGKSSREIVRIYAEEDKDGKHIYFEVEGLKNGREEVSES